MAFLNAKIRALYAAAIGAFGVAAGASLDSLPLRSQEVRAAQPPVYLKSAPAAAQAPKAPVAPARVVTVERKIEGMPIEWWRARAVATGAPSTA